MKTQTSRSLSHHILSRKGTCHRHDLSLQRLTWICLVFPPYSALWKVALCGLHLRSEGLFPQRVVSGKAWQGCLGAPPPGSPMESCTPQEWTRLRVSVTLRHRLDPARDRSGLSTDVAMAFRMWQLGLSGSPLPAVRDLRDTSSWTPGPQGGASCKCFADSPSQVPSR